MGIIEKQTIKGSFWSFFGAFVAFLNVTILMPRLLSTSQVGLVNVLVAIATICAQFASLGMDAVTTRLFPYFRSKEYKHHGYPFLMLMVGVIGFFLWLFLMKVGVEQRLISHNEANSPLLVGYIHYVVPLVFFLLFFNAFDVLYRLLFNAVIGTFLKEVVVRVLNLILLFIYFCGILTFDQFLFIYVAILGVPLIAILYQLIKREGISFRPNLQFLTPKLTKEMRWVALFGIISGFSGIAIVNIDKYMVTSYLGLSQNGIYSIAFYFGTMVLLPARALKKIGASVISEAWRNNDIKLIEKTYQNSALYQYIMGAILYGGILINLKNIEQILPEEYSSGVLVIVIIGFSNLLEMISGQGAVLLANSHKYRVQAFFQLLLMVLVIVTNAQLIPILGIEGAAMATLISNLIVLLLRGVYIYRRWQVQPIQWKLIRVIFSSTCATALVLCIPYPLLTHWLGDIVVRSSIFLLLMGIANYKTIRRWWEEKRRG
ncbi:polysaccharide biosynthesis C-terminal domain-containing protein [Halosquirtibacter laminarini]|uniref:Polysaccharide biosynthesis C-terminal domain-containing protein n=1 Tax=Halosquirtibacter laminarini TaxID=3374600 RepID=A0AC61NDY5_9BACT|nr:polysaccharide biosynthesis C-terminal domain-containing protein [Prolixibacteraceae bacterium]